METQTFSLEVKADKESGKFSGYGSVFGNVDGGRDIVMPGAFADSLRDWKARGKLPRMLWCHDMREPLGVYTEMREDTHGLYVEGRFTTGVAKAAEVYALMKDGAVDGLSIGYRTLDDEYDRDVGVRKIVKVDLYECSLVALPMNEAARVTAVKSRRPGEIKTIREFEAFLRDAGGFSSNAAKAIASGGFKSSEPRDEDEGLEDLLRTLRDVRSGLPA